MAVIDDRGFAVGVAARPENRNPKSAFCLLHLRRICGTCGYFEGQLRPSRIGRDPKAAETARCGYFDQLRNLNNDAAKCHRWHRKSAPYKGAGQ